ncbi:MAG TPA: restriction endonuclease subunit S [Candidatus Companilactobacillus pullicola]|uniref:Restriction endonuclease subunit S n=1 Tax=Candidatus Companilactobacillus pullicola TaxID=2838523 RepID=A0A9D1ZN45_9LACO|nr:restriction endonuclease subunit S [Candidatus Companilactobacillus pullicola]
MTKADKEGQRKAPILRFKGFTDDWEQRKLGNLFNERKEKSTKGELLSVTLSNGVTKFSDLNKKDNSNIKSGNYKVVKKNDIPYNSMRMWQGASGVSSYDGIVSPAYTVLVPNRNSNSNFYAVLFKKKSILNLFTRFSQGLTSDTWNLKYPILKDIIVPFTNLEEQKRIFKIFNVINNLLALYDRKLKLLSQVKKYFLDNLFAEKEYPNLRFKYFKKDKWEKTSLNSIVTYSNGKAHEKEINNKGNLDLVMMNSITTGGRLITKKKILSPQDTLNKNDIVIVLSDIAKGELIGKSSVIPCDNQYVLNQRIGCLHPTLNIDSFFVSKYINQKNRYFKSHAAGTSQINLSKSDVLNCTIYIPKVDEQHCVSNFIINVEKIINFYEYKKRHIIQIKNILLNTMFI